MTKTIKRKKYNLSFLPSNYIKEIPMSSIVKELPSLPKSYQNIRVLLMDNTGASKFVCATESNRKGSYIEISSRVIGEKSDYIATLAHEFSHYIYFRRFGKNKFIPSTHDKKFYKIFIKICPQEYWHEEYIVYPHSKKIIKGLTCD